MSRLQQLLDELCPNGVEYRELGEICTIETGKKNANAMVLGGKYRFFTCSTAISQINTYCWDTEAILIAGNGHIGTVHYYIGKFDAYQRTYVLTSFRKDILPKYIYYVTLHFFKEYALMKTHEASVPYIVLKTVMSFPIPTPPPTRSRRDSAYIRYVYRDCSGATEGATSEEEAI